MRRICLAVVGQNVTTSVLGTHHSLFGPIFGRGAHGRLWHLPRFLEAFLFLFFVRLQLM